MRAHHTHETRGGKIALTTLDVTTSIVGRVLLGGAMFASGVGWDAPPVIIGSLIIVGSAVPLWFKARKAERLGASPDTKEIQDRVERQLLAAQDREAQQYADIEQNTNRIAELEERLEFMERLLAKRRAEGEIGEL